MYLSFACALALTVPAAGDTGDLSDAQMALAVTAISKAADEGLSPEKYRIALPPRKEAVAAAFERYIRDLTEGRAELKALDADVVLPASPSEATNVWQGSNLTDLSPSHPNYVQLRTALARYRKIAAQGGWEPLPEATPSFFAAEGAPLLRRRLAFEDDELASSPDGDLVAAMLRFQRRQGLPTDGVVGKSTLASLNVTATARVNTIIANMERWRWLPRALEPDRIEVNVAGTELKLILNNQVALTSKVIVGRPSDPTPILRAVGAGITVNPPWTVPHRIAALEILPKLKRNPSYLATQDMALLDGPPGDPQGQHVNWRAIPAGTFPYRLRQHSGPRNPLGRIKVELPNPLDVYLHDTPGQAAFARTDRALSHGCVRVAQILPLASFLLSADLESSAKIVAAIDAEETTYFPLQKKMPIYFLYWTAFPGSDGIEFRSDIYGRDERMLRVLQPQPTRVASLPSCHKA